MTTKPTSMLHYKWAHWPCTHLEPRGQEAAASSSTQGHTTTGTAVQRTLLQLSGPYAHLRGHIRERDRFHLSFFCLPFHPDLVQHRKPELLAQLCSHWPLSFCLHRFLLLSPFLAACRTGNSLEQNQKCQTR